MSVTSPTSATLDHMQDCLRPEFEEFYSKPREKQDGLEEKAPLAPLPQALDVVRWLLRLDLLCVMEVALEGSAVRLLESSFAFRQDGTVKDRLESIRQAISQVSRERWECVLNSLPHRLHGTAPLDRASFQRLFRGLQLPEAQIPNCGAAAWLSAPAHEVAKKRFLYVAVWSAEASSNLTTKALEVNMLVQQFITGREGRLAYVPGQYMTGVAERVVYQSRAGDGVYPLISPRPWLYRYKEKEFAMDGFDSAPAGSEYKGRADTELQAEQDFAESIHIAFQRLQGIPSYERTKEQKEQWKFLCEHIDVRAYREQLPLVYRRIGWVRAKPRRGPWTVEWVDGEIDEVPLNKAPTEFASFEVGTRFAAYVAYRLKAGILSDPDTQGQGEEKGTFRAGYHELLVIRVCEPLPDIQVTPQMAEKVWGKEPEDKPTAPEELAGPARGSGKPPRSARRND